MRCVHEASQYDQNCVVTLTYAKEYLPENESCKHEDAETFIKDLREHYRYHHKKTGIRTYGCQEYGEKYGRPHYHIILFNHWFEDTQEILGRPGYYTSQILEQIWAKGKTEIMDMTFETAAYVARYIMKKQNVSKATPPAKAAEIIALYEKKETERPVCISRDGGIGKKWYEQWKEEIYKQDKVYRQKNTGEYIAIKPPKYYDRRYEIENPDEYKKIKIQRRNKNRKRIDKIQKEIQDGNYTNATDGFGARQLAYITCQEAKMKLLKRGYENDPQNVLNTRPSDERIPHPNPAENSRRSGKNLPK